MANSRASKDSYRSTSSSPILPLSFSHPSSGPASMSEFKKFSSFLPRHSEHWQQQLVAVACLDQNDLKVKKDATKLPLILEVSFTMRWFLSHRGRQRLSFASILRLRAATASAEGSWC